MTGGAVEDVRHLRRDDRAARRMVGHAFGSDVP
jgi:hypothetical protein